MATSKIDFVRKLFKGMTKEQVDGFSPNKLAATVRCVLGTAMTDATAANYKSEVKREMFGSNGTGHAEVVKMQEDSSNTVGGNVTILPPGTTVSPVNTFYEMLTALEQLRRMVGLFGKQNVFQMVEFIEPKKE